MLQPIARDEQKRAFSPFNGRSSIPMGRSRNGCRRSVILYQGCRRHQCEARFRIFRSESLSVHNTIGGTVMLSLRADLSIRLASPGLAIRRRFSPLSTSANFAKADGVWSCQELRPIFH